MAPRNTELEMQLLSDSSQSLPTLTDAEFMEILHGQIAFPWNGELTEEFIFNQCSMPDPSCGTYIDSRATSDTNCQQTCTTENSNSRQTTLQPRSGPHSSKTAQSLQCFEHGCNGRLFSCHENYLRHVREKGGKSATTCLFCGTEFTRRSNRDKHVAQKKCRPESAIWAERFYTG